MTSRRPRRSIAFSSSTSSPRRATSEVASSAGASEVCVQHDPLGAQCFQAFEIASQLFECALANRPVRVGQREVGQSDSDARREHRHGALLFGRGATQQPKPRDGQPFKRRIERMPGVAEAGRAADCGGAIATNPDWRVWSPDSKRASLDVAKANSGI